eukprot:TRINITY_DN35609_c0_g1_i3.p1 TRINITY_DN35609_c0_g1~~TRINITY_DN35609_c0_g1_i3.p1  ORF type:complete len:629 (+),score=92.75 TRINITY_DN35609_c0_g1_i3:97-1983(+)
MSATLHHDLRESSSGVDAPGATARLQPSEPTAWHDIAAEAFRQRSRQCRDLIDELERAAEAAEAESRRPRRSASCSSSRSGGACSSEPPFSRRSRSASSASWRCAPRIAVRHAGGGGGRLGRCASGRHNSYAALGRRRYRAEVLLRNGSLVSVPPSSMSSICSPSLCRPAAPRLEEALSGSHLPPFDRLQAKLSQGFVDEGEGGGSSPSSPSARWPSQTLRRPPSSEVPTMLSESSPRHCAQTQLPPCHHGVSLSPGRRRQPSGPGRPRRQRSALYAGPGGGGGPPRLRGDPAATTCLSPRPDGSDCTSTTASTGVADLPPQLAARLIGFRPTPASSSSATPRLLSPRDAASARGCNTPPEACGTPRATLLLAEVREELRRLAEAARHAAIICEASAPLAKALQLQAERELAGLDEATQTVSRLTPALPGGCRHDRLSATERPLAGARLAGAFPQRVLELREACASALALLQAALGDRRQAGGPPARSEAAYCADATSDDAAEEEEALARPPPTTASAAGGWGDDSSSGGYEGGGAAQSGGLPSGLVRATGNLLQLPPRLASQAAARLQQLSQRDTATPQRAASVNMRDTLSRIHALQARYAPALAARVAQPMEPASVAATAVAPAVY